MRHRDRISFGLVVAALLISVLCIGGALREIQAVVALLVAAALTIRVLAVRRLDRPSPLLVFFGVAMGLTAIQLLPLPDGVLAFLNTAGQTLRKDGAAIAGTSAGSSISLDPAGTVRGLAYLAILGGVAVVSLRFAASERGRYALLVTVASVCGLAALVTGIHVVVNASSLYGIYEPAHATPLVFGPLLNANHLGSLMALGSVVSIGLAFYSHQRVQLRVVWIVNAIGCVLVVFATLSRGAALAFAFGSAVTVGLMIAQRLDSRAGRRRGSSVLTTQLPIAITFAFGLGLAVYTGAGKVASQLDNTSLTELSQPSSKYAAWKSSIELLTEAPLFGIGRGALEPALTRVHEPAAYVTFSHLENEYLQALIEWGIVGAILLGGVFLWGMIRALKRWRDGPLAAAALGAMAGVLLQSSVDFGIELLGLAVPLTMVASTVLVVPVRESRSRQATVGVRLLAIGGLVAAALLMLSSVTKTVQEDHDDLVAEQPDLAGIRAVIQRHPIDYFGFGQAAAVLMRTNNQQAVRYLNQALTLHPTHPGLHRLAARMLAASGLRKQAAIQYSLALHGASAPNKLLPEVFAQLPNVDDAALAMPVDSDVVELIYHSLKDLNRDDIIVRWLARVIVQPHIDVSVVDRLYALAMSRKDFATGELAAHRRLQIAKTNTSRLMMARVYAARGDHARLLASLSDVTTWNGRIDEKAEAWLLVCDVRIDRKEWDHAVECIHQLDGSGAIGPGKRDEVNRRLTAIKDQRTMEARQHAVDELEKQIRKSSPKTSPDTSPR